MNKELQIIAPEGYEIDKEKSSFEKIVFKKVKKKLTYEQVADKLFKGKNHYYTDEDGDVTKANIGWHCPNVAPTEHQLKRLLILNKLMNIAHYLNDGWEPNWENDLQAKYCIYYNYNRKAFDIDYNNSVAYGEVFFKSKELAQQAIEILGEETIKLALGV